jgi:NADH-quinone oxidoreductase subunit N
MGDALVTDLSRFLPELALTATFLVAILVDLIFRRSPIPVAAVVMAGLIASGFLVLGQTGMSFPLFTQMLAVDSFAVFFKLLIIVTAILIVVFSLMSQELAAGGRRVGEYYFLLVALTLGMMLMAGATNLLMIYLAVELSSLTSYVLSGYTKESPDSSEASLKYLIFGALSSGLMLYGMSILYGLTDTLSIYALNRELPAILAAGGSGSYAALIAGVLILAGFGYKISAVPFHFWAPDVYEGAPITITAFLAVGSKAAGFALLMRFFKVTFIDTTAAALPPGAWATLQGVEWTTILAVLSVLTMTVGNLIAIWQNNLKRLLAYSSIAHAGYMLMGVVVLNNEGLSAVMLYFVVYLFMNLGAFLCVMLIADKTGSEDIEEYKGLGSRSPFLAVAFTIFLVSLTGIPPAAGFIGKLYLFSALINHGWVWLAIVGAINSVIALYYYLRIVRNMFLRPGDEAQPAIAFGPLQIATVLVLLVPTLLFGLYFSPISRLAQASVQIFGTP